jgi:tetratricopeptide (TPR) repeat protein
MLPLAVVLVAAAGLSGAPVILAQQPDTLAQVQQAEKLIGSGDLAGAIAALEKVVAASPASFDARLVLGRALDLDGKYEAARRHLEEAVRLANDEERNTALADLGISYAFESKPDEAARYYQRAFDAQLQADDRGGAAGLANALGRIYLESGNLQKAEQWYTTGYEMAKKVPDLTASQAALWEMRWHHAVARIAARRGNAAAARKHAEAVKTLLDTVNINNQRVFYPYLLGYISFFAKQYRPAIDELSKGDQTDPFVVGLIAQSYQKLGDRTKAGEYYRKVMALTTHSINSAFARPLARAFLR